MPARSRRKLIVVLLVVFAGLGGALRMAAPEPSTLRDVGTLLLVLWLPVVGNVVGFLMRKLPRRAQEPPFAPGQAFSPHVQVELTGLPTPSGALRALPAAGAICTVVLGSRGFTARHGAGSGEPGIAGVTALEFARPELARPNLPEGATFVLALGTEAVARGRVLAVCEPTDRSLSRGASTDPPPPAPHAPRLAADPCRHAAPPA